MADDSGQEREKSPGTKVKQAYEKIGLQFSQQLLEFIESQKKKGKTMPENKNDLIALFLQEIKKKDTSLHDQYETYITTFSKQTNIDNVTFAHLEDLPIGKEGRLSDFFAQRQAQNFEESKQTTVFDIRKDHYTKAVNKSGDKRIIEEWKQLCAGRFGKEGMKKLIANGQLLPQLQKLFDTFFKEYCNQDNQKKISSYLQNDDHRPTIKTYLKAFEQDGLDIKNQTIREALLKDKKRDGKKTQGVLSLSSSLAQLTQVTLMEHGLLARDKKEALIHSFDNTFSHTEINKGIFSSLPREQYIIEKDPFSLFGNKYTTLIKDATHEIEANTFRAQYEKELLKGYLDRAHETMIKKGSKSSKANLMEQLGELSSLSGTEFSSQTKALKETITTYLKEDYLEQSIDHDIIKEQMKQFGIDQEKYFPDYLAFWKQVYDLDSKTAIFNKDGELLKLIFLDKKIVTYPKKFTSVDNLDDLFSFERSIDFKNSDKLFSTLFGTTPKGYIVDDTTGKIIDTIQEHEFALYTGEATLANRLILSKKNKITITDKKTGQIYSGYPERVDGSENKEQPGEAMHNPTDIDLHLIDEQGKSVSPYIPLILNEGTPHTHEITTSIDASLYSIEATERTFIQPAKPPVVTQLLQTALFKSMNPEDNQIPIRYIAEQKNMLHENIEPTLPGYVSNNKESPFSSYTFQSTVPDAIIQEVKSRTSENKKKTKEQIAESVKAWIDKGAVCFNKTYFCKKYTFTNIDIKDGTLYFTDTSGTTEIRSLREAIDSKNPQIKKCVKELISAKTHEVTHRLLHFHGINNITTSTKTGENIDLTQEDLCEIADKRSNKRIKDKEDNRRYVTVRGEEIWVDDIAAEIAKKIPGFSRSTINKLDANNLEAYEADYELFADLLVANVATGGVEMSTEGVTTPSRQIVSSSRQAMTHRINKYLEEIDNNFDPTNQNQVQQRALARQHLNNLTEQELTISGNPTEEELTKMNEQQIEAAQFLQQNRNTKGKKQKNDQILGNNQQDSNSNIPGQSKIQQNENTSGQSNNPSQGNNAEIAGSNEQNDIVNGEEQAKFDEGFSSFKGDIVAPLEVGTALFLKENISEIPGRGFNWVKYTVTSVTDNDVFLEMSDASEKQVTKKSEVKIPRTGNSIEKLKRIGKNEVYKFGKNSANKGGFMDSIKNIIGEKWGEIDNFKKKIQTDDTEKTELVTHVGNLKEKIVSSDRSENILYKVDRGTKDVVVSSAIPDGVKGNEKRKSLRTKKMDYDTFQMFCFTKGLNPLTSTEVKRSGERLNPDNILNDGLPRQPISLAAIRKGLKAIPETYKKKFEEEQEFQTALATDYLSNLIPSTSFLFLDEVKNDMGGTDGLVRNRIQKFKSERAATGESDKASVHANPISENIKANVFGNIGSTRKYKYKAAGALLYAIENGGPYFRKLAEYENKDGGGRWIKCILGESARQQFLKERQRKVDQYKSMGGSADEIQSEIAKFELQFLQDGTQDKPGWGSKFGREIESNKDTLYGGASSLDPNAFSKKGDFPYMLDAFRGGGLGGNLPRALMSSLEAMKAAVETPDHYNQFYMCILQIFATGMVHKFPQDYVNKLKGIGRSRGIPITLLAGDAHASGKAMRILDHIAHNAGIKTFSDFSGNSLSKFDEMHVQNYDTQKSKKIRDSFGNRWSNYGGTVMDAFNYKNEYLINIPEESGQEENTRIVKDYLGSGGVFGGYKGIQNNESVDQIDGQSPFFQEGLLNLSEGSFRSYMMKFNAQGQLTNEHSVSLWSSFSTMLDQFGTNIESSNQQNVHRNTANEVMTRLLYKKFLQFFGDNELNGVADQTFPESQQGKSYKDLFKSAIKAEIGMESLIRKVIFKEKERQVNQQEGYIVREDISNTQVKDTILKFAGLIKKSYANLNDSASEANILEE